jgi:hypothetical protein
MDPMRDKPTPSPIKLFCGLIGSDESIARAVELLVPYFGDIDCESPIIPFEFTGYYRAEMGERLRRKWIGFGELKKRSYLAPAKDVTVQIEGELSKDGQRTVNIDPGYVDNAQVVLATTKNFAHRIYIGMGYYAEVTMIYKDKDFQSLEWTYADYISQAGLDFFRHARNIYHGQVRPGSET